MIKHDGRVTKDGINIHEAADFAGMHKAGRLAAEILDRIAPMVEPGVTTGALDKAIEDMVDEAGAKSATIGYRGYQHASCISVNHVICHGIPGAPIPMGKDETISKNLEKRR
ncbi:MAG: M24 family metallopeptidase, partial [Halocynthiibacter sp.]